MIKLTVHEEQKVNEKNDQTLNSPHTITTARRTDNIPLICTGAGPIHLVHSQPMSLATEALPETRLHFCHFPAVNKMGMVACLDVVPTPSTRKEPSNMCQNYNF